MVNALATWSTVSFCWTASATGKISSDAFGGHDDTPHDDARARPGEQLHEAVRQVLHLGPGVGRQRQHDRVGVASRRRRSPSAE